MSLLFWDSDMYWMCTIIFVQTFSRHDLQVGIDYVPYHFGLIGIEQTM